MNDVKLIAAMAAILIAAAIVINSMTGLGIIPILVLMGVAVVLLK